MTRLRVCLIVVLVVGVFGASVAPGQSDAKKTEAGKIDEKKAEESEIDAGKAETKTKPQAAKPKESVEKKAAPQPVAAVFSIDGPIVEKPKEEDFPFPQPGMRTLRDIVSRLEKARNDDQVKAVVFLLDQAFLDLAQIEELRQAIDSVKSAGKPVYAHIDAMVDTPGYVLATGASEVSVTPTAIMFITGFSAESPYLRGLLDWIGVKPDFLTCGDYKTAAETFMRKGPSPAAEQMQDWLLDSLYETCLDMISKGRGVPVEQARLWINEGLYTPEKAKRLHLIDRVEFRQDLAERLKAKHGENLQFKKDYGEDRKEEIDLSSPFAALKIWAEILQGGKKKTMPRNSVAVVYVEGAIVPGQQGRDLLGGQWGAYSSTIRKALDKAAGDENVKAVVLRVNSPGGSAVASEIILDATRRVAAKKPFVVSMGSVAGSGGYYVSCGAETIFADATTITASIGVVGGKFATSKVWDKVGITWDIDRRGDNAGLLGTEDVFSDEQRRQMQDWMNDIYGVFKQHVVAARGKKLKKPIDQVAGGRVYTGKQALDLGLVDKIGTLHDAIAFAAEKAGMEKYEVISLPEPKSFFELLFEEMSGKQSDDNRLAAGAGPPISPRPASIVELAMPHLKGLDSQRVAEVVRALRRMEMLQHERVLLMMPELSIRFGADRPAAFLPQR